MPTQLDITIQHNPGTGLPANVHNQINAYVLAYSGKQVRIRVSPPERSSGANRYWWGFVVRPIIEAVRATGNDGYTGEMFHRQVNEATCTPEQITAPDGTIMRMYSSKKLDSAQFTARIEYVKNLEFVRRLGVRFETPQEYQDRTQQTFRSWGIE